MRLAAFFCVAAALALVSTSAEPARVQGPTGEKHDVDSAEELILRAAGLSTDGDALLAFFQERMRNDADLDKLVALARQLGAPDAATKGKATAKLLGRGHWAIPALHVVINDFDNPLATKQARHCLECLEGKRGTELAIAAAKLLGARKPADAAKTLLAYLPFADDQSVVEGVKGALDKIAALPGTTDPALVAALRDTVPLRRAVAAEVLAGSGRQEVLPEVRKLLADAKPQVRLRAALALAKRLDEKAVVVLINLLAELPSDGRRQAEQALHQLAGEWAPMPLAPTPGDGKGDSDDDLSRKVRREVWAGWWQTLDGPTLVAAFRQRTLTKEEYAKAEALIDQLGDKSYAIRDRATMELVLLGPKVLSLVRAAANSSDLEQARRAQICLKQITLRVDKEKLPAAAPRLLAMRQPGAACGALLAFLPFTEDGAIKGEIGNTLKILALVGGQPDPAVLTALKDPLPVRRIAAAEALIGAGATTQIPAVRKLLEEADPQLRLRVALALVQGQDKGAIKALIDVLGDLPRSEVWEAEDVLHRLAGGKAPAVPVGDDAAARSKLRAAWTAWWNEHGAAVDIAVLGKATAAVDLMVVAELGAGGAIVPAKKKGAGPGGGKKAAVVPAIPGPGPDRLVAVDRNGKVQWQIEDLAHPIDFHMLSGERVLIAEYSGNRVTERDFKGNIVWKVDLPSPPVSVQRLANGNTFIALYGAPKNGGGTMIEADKAGKTVATFDNVAEKVVGPKATTKSPVILAAYKMTDGQIICAQSKGIQSKASCVRLDASGKEIKHFLLPSIGAANAVVAQMPNIAGNIDVTAKGHIVVMLDDNTVAEYDPDGKLIWQVKAEGNRATRLSNGNTLVASLTGGVVELDKAGKTVWKYPPPAGYQAVRARPATGAIVAAAQPVLAKVPANAAYGGIDPKVIAAWERAGAQFGWLATDLTGPNRGFTPARPANSAANPSFRFQNVPPQGGLAALPPPTVPFGLQFSPAKGKGGMQMDAHLKELAGFKQVQTLDLRSNQVTDAGLKELAGLKQLQRLYLGSNLVTDAGLKGLAGLKQLEMLGLGDTNVTDAGLKELAGFKQLQTLDLRNNQVTDVGLKELAGLKQLQHVTLTGSLVTPAGIAELQKTLPNLAITGGGTKGKKGK